MLAGSIVFGVTTLKLDQNIWSQMCYSLGFVMDAWLRGNTQHLNFSIFRKKII